MAPDTVIRMRYENEQGDAGRSVKKMDGLFGWVFVPLIRVSCSFCRNNEKEYRYGGAEYSLGAG